MSQDAGPRGAGSLNISGAGSAAGGVYESVSIAGAGKITGDVEAKSIRISGAGKVEGSVKAGTFHGSGAFDVRGNLEADEFVGSGAGKVNGRLVAKTVRCSGALKTGGAVRAGDMRVAGHYKAAGDVEAESFRSDGAVDIAGLLNAEKVEIDLGGESSIREIGGSRITVARGPSAHLGLDFLSFHFFWDKRRACLKTDSVEGDDVHLEATQAAMVRGRRVKIGPGCRVRSVEYSESLQIDTTAEVKGRTHTGEGPAPAVETVTLSRPEGSPEDGGGRCGTWTVAQGWWSRHPVLRAPFAILGILLAAGLVYVAVAIVLQVVAFVLILALACVVVCLILGAVGVPVMVVGALLRDLLLLPFRALTRLFGWSWPSPRLWW